MRKPRLALTLVEVSVVLAIVTLLAALLFAAFARVREGGRATTCLSNQKQILLALQLYRDDTAGIFPVDDSFSPFPRSWIDALHTYTRSAQVFVCPTDSEIESKREFGFQTAPDGSHHPVIPTSYLASQNLLGRLDSEESPLRGVTEAEVVRPASTIFLSDGAKQTSRSAPYWTDEADTHNMARSLAVLGYSLAPPPDLADPEQPDFYAPHPRHNGRAVVGFVDGHVKSMDLATWYFPYTPYLDPSRGG